MKIIFSEAGKKLEKDILNSIEKFNTEGQIINDGLRNNIKIFKIAGGTLNIKSFKIPILLIRSLINFLEHQKLNDHSNSPMF